MASYTYPLTMPTTGFVQSSWKLVRAISVSQSPFTGQSQTIEYDKALWSCTVSLPPMRRSTAALWQSFFMKLHGRKGTFLMGDPDAKTVQGVLTGTATVQAAKAVGVDAINITVPSSGNNGNVILKAGDYLQLDTGADARLYMVVNDATASSVANVSIDIEPPLKKAITTSTAIDYTSAQAVMRMDNNDLGWDANHISTYGISFSCTEAQ